MAVSKRTRYEVLRRDNHSCRYCGAGAPDAALTVDHVTPVTLGGSDDPGNLVTACKDCNSGKSSTTPDAALVTDVKQDALRWSAAMKIAADRLGAREEPLRKYMTYMEDVIRQYYGGFGELPHDWRETIEQFYRAGLPINHAERAFDISMMRVNVPWSAKWRYACGVAWTILREIQDEARRIVESD